MPTRSQTTNRKTADPRKSSGANDFVLHGMMSETPPKSAKLQRRELDASSTAKNSLMYAVDGYLARNAGALRNTASATTNSSQKAQLHHNIVIVIVFVLHAIAS